jgi:hypothetical protein
MKEREYRQNYVKALKWCRPLAKSGDPQAQLLLGLGDLISGTFPQIVDRIAFCLHICYPPILQICIGMVIVLIQQLQLFTVTFRSEARLKQLAQEVALMSKLLEERDEEKEKVAAQAS